MTWLSPPGGATIFLRSIVHLADPAARGRSGHPQVLKSSASQPTQLAPISCVGAPASKSSPNDNSTAPKLALADAIRVLAMDVQQANSGHPGAPMGMAEIARPLDRATCATTPRIRPGPTATASLSNGHGSMLIYALLHLTGYDLPIEELKNFRQLHSKTPGHPEVGITLGVETTTGPLGQGLGNAVGMAPKRCWPPSSTSPATPVDHHTYAFTGDGCLMEGISHEVCSPGRHAQAVQASVALYDDNGISIDGHVEHWFADDTAKRFEGYGWNVIRGVDGHDAAAVDAAIAARAQSETLIVCRDRHRQGPAHGRHPQRARRAAGQGRDRRHPRRAGLVGRAVPDPAGHLRWLGRPQDQRRRAGRMASAFDAYAAEFPAEAAEFTRRMKARVCRLRRPIQGVPERHAEKGRNRRHPQGLAVRDHGVGRRAAGKCWAARPT